VMYVLTQGQQTAGMKCVLIYYITIEHLLTQGLISYITIEHVLTLGQQTAGMKCVLNYSITIEHLLI